MIPAFSYHGIAGCVTHLYVRNNGRHSTEDSSVKVCDATMLNAYSLARLIKITLITYPADNLKFVVKAAKNTRLQ